MTLAHRLGCIFWFWAGALCGPQLEWLLLSHKHKQEAGHHYLPRGKRIFLAISCTITFLLGNFFLGALAWWGISAAVKLL